MDQFSFSDHGADFRALDLLNGFLRIIAEPPLQREHPAVGSITYERRKTRLAEYLSPYDQCTLRSRSESTRRALSVPVRQTQFESPVAPDIVLSRHARIIAEEFRGLVDGAGLRVHQ